MFTDDEYFIEDDRLKEILTDMRKATNMYSKLPLETKTSVFLYYLNAIDCAYEHFTNFEIREAWL